MSKPFDPRRILRKISNTLVRQLFDKHGGLPDVPWAAISETNIQPVFDAWQALPADRRDQIQAVLQDIHDLADDVGARVLFEEVQRVAPGRLDDLSSQADPADRAAWTYLNVDRAFDNARPFARADSLRGRRAWEKRNGLPKQQIELKDAPMLLREALSRHYWNAEGRGLHCMVELQNRGDDISYYFAYVEDYPEKAVVFGDDGALVRREQRRAFDAYFAFNRAEGSVESYAPGGRKVHDRLHKLFCAAVLGQDPGPSDPLKPAYVLDHLLVPGRPLPTDPADQIVSVAITSIRMCPVDRPGEYVEIAVNHARGPSRIDAAIEEYLNHERLGIGRFIVQRAVFRLQFARGAPSRTMTFSVTAPSTCDLRTRPERQQLIGEHCLRLWGVIP